MTRELWEAFLVYNVSRFEAYVAEVLGIVLACDPERLRTNVPGLSVPKPPRVPNAIAGSGPLAESIESFVDKILRLSPRQYLDFVFAATGVQLDQSLEHLGDAEAGRPHGADWVFTAAV